MSRWFFVLLLLGSSLGYAQYYDDDYEDDYYGSPFNPPQNNPNAGANLNGNNPQSQKGGFGYQPSNPSAMAGQDLQNDAGRMIPSEQGQLKFKIVEGQFWDKKKKRRASRQ